MLKLYKNISELVTMQSAYKKDGRNLIPTDLSIIKDGAIVFDENEIHWIGSTTEIPSEYSTLKSLSLKGKTLTPELVDSHTHLVFAGDRSHEYSMRLNGEDYQAIAQAGGGILATTKATNEINLEQLYKVCCQRIDRIASYGVGTIEIKSGYGLNYDKEKQLTLLIDRLKKNYAPKIQIFNTFMPAHAVSKEFKNAQEYIEKVILPLMDELVPQGVIDAVDIFHEKGYFSSEEVIMLFEEAKGHGLKLKTHADEFQDNNGATLAANYKCLSTDHLLRTSMKGKKDLAASGTVATFLPGTAFFLGKEQVNARSFLDQGVKVAIASDYNPGSCHFDNLLLLTSMVAPTYKMNQCELWSAITLNASHALGLLDQGVILKGMKPRFSIWDCKSLDLITYNWGKNNYLDLQDLL